jgi:hypothetical protein
LWAKDSLQRIFINKDFLFTVEVLVAESGSQLGPDILSRTFGSRRCCPTKCGSGWDNSEKTLCCGFRNTCKAMGQAYQLWWRICREIYVLSMFENHMFYFRFISILTHLLILPGILIF